MSRQNKINMPMSGGGLMRYFEEFRSNIEFSPGSVVVLILVVIVIMIFLHAYGTSILGL